MTGPATEKILPPNPAMNPSLLNSMAAETTAFAKPVMGTRVPAPAFVASLSYTPKPVNRPPRKIKITETQAAAAFSSPTFGRSNSKRTSPIRQMVPPMRNAQMMFFRRGDLGW